MKTGLALITLLSIPERRKALALLGLILVMALLDMIGVASIMPFMAVLANPELVNSDATLNLVFEMSRIFGVQNQEEFLFFLGSCVLAVLVISLAFKAFTTYFQTRFAMMCEYSIGRRLIEGYLQQPYSWFLDRHSADLGKNILSEVNAVIVNCMIPGMTLMSQSAVVLSLIILLVVVDPIMALSTGLLLGLTYWVMFIVVSRKLKNLGKSRVLANTDRFTVVNEVFSAVKDIKVSSLERVYLQRFEVPAREFAESQATAQVIGQIPRFVLEAIAFGGLLLVLLYLMVKHDSFQSAVPVITLYAFAGYRLMPALQQGYQALTRLHYSYPTLDALHKDLNSFPDIVRFSDNIKPLEITKAITLDKISFRYNNSSYPALHEISLSIPVNSRVGFVGSTGSGKTTLVDMILGLLEPQKGRLSIDGHQITGYNRRQWQSGIGYVSQHIYLSDASIAANIAFGNDQKSIDQLSVESAAKIANLHDFVVKDLPEGYSTKVGERGVRLSGGQRQRIGIARALYNRPKILILDEATSALDNISERMVMEALKNLHQEMTVILVAHRLSTVEDCDQIFLMERGEIKASGTYNTLLTCSEHFSSMAGNSIKADDGEI